MNDARPATGAAAPGTVIRNAMTVDVEDYFQVQALSDAVSRQDWSALPGRVEHNTNRVLDLFAETGVKAPFFTLGWIAERHPPLIRRILAEGHELASHGWAHFRADEQSREGFRDDIRRTKSLYGMPEAPRFPFRPIVGSTFREFPITSVRRLGRNWPCGGGGWFRLLPYAVSAAAIRAVHHTDRRACLFYFHPWEIDPDQPIQHGLSRRSRFRHYTNLARMEAKLRRLCGEFAWDRMDRVLDAELPG